MQPRTIVRHPDGRYVFLMERIIGSDLWFFREVRRDGTLGRLEWGSGWTIEDQK